MKFQSASRSLSAWLWAAAAAFVVAACGGGGAGQVTGPAQGGAPIMSPDGATFFAGVPNTITITGGLRPYTLTSSEPSLMPVPSTLDSGSFQVVPANPGVIDANLPPNSLPVRTVNISLRDARGQITAISIKVGQNFLTGFGVRFSSNCPAPAEGTAPVACSGGETAVFLSSVTNGNLFGNRAVRFEVIRGPFQFISPAAGVVGGNVTTTTDHSGTATVIFRVDTNVRTTTLAVLRVVDVATGVYVDEVFAITGAGTPAALTAIPNTFTFTGALSNVCGTGSGDFLVFDGQPPYNAVSSDPNIRVTPSSTSANPGTFTVQAFNPNVCVTGGTIIVTDSQGSRTTVTVNTAPGSQAPPAPVPLTVAPSSVTLACGTSGSVSAVGGNGSFFVASTHPRITAVASGNTITISRLAGDGAASFPTTGSISVTDGTTIQTVTVTVPANCP